MKSHRKELWFEIPQRRAFLNITAEIEAKTVVKIIAKTIEKKKKNKIKK
jgi:hypothetical protein